MPLKVTRKQAKVLQQRLDGGVDDVTPRRRRDNEELKHQILLFDRRKEMMEKYPDLRWLFGTMNGVYIPPALLKQVSQAGLIRGVFDVLLPVAAQHEGAHYCGVAIEMKRLRGGRPSPEQIEWAAHLIAQGWRVYFCAGVMDAWWSLCAYLRIDGRDHFAPDLAQQEEYIRLVSANYS